jgi:hypothetical protein
VCDRGALTEFFASRFQQSFGREKNQVAREYRINEPSRRMLLNGGGGVEVLDVNRGKLTQTD